MCVVTGAWFDGTTMIPASIINQAVSLCSDAHHVSDNRRVISGWTHQRRHQLVIVRLSGGDIRVRWLTRDGDSPWMVPMKVKEFSDTTEVLVYLDQLESAA